MLLKIVAFLSNLTFRINVARWKNQLSIRIVKIVSNTLKNQTSSHFAKKIYFDSEK